jgi:hypothetical protein
MKHVLPRLARPLPTLRTDGHDHADALARVERVRDDDAARGTLRG